MHKGDDLLAAARWALTRERPTTRQLQQMSSSQVAYPVTAPNDEDDVPPTVGLMIGEEGKRARVLDPQPLHEALEALNWEADTRPGPVLAEAKVEDSDGTVVYLEEADGTDRLAVLYFGRIYNQAMYDRVTVQVSLHQDERPLPASVESIRAQRRAGTWTVPPPAAA